MLARPDIWAHLLVPNLIRAAMAEAARRHDLTPRQVSLPGARQNLKAFRAELNRVPRRAALALTEAVLGAIVCHRVGDGPGRTEPRVVKRRTNANPRIQVPRTLA